VELSDADLIRRARQGEPSAFDQLILRHADALYRLARVLVGNSEDAEDVVQETYLGAVKGLDRFQGRSTVKTWLTGILLRQARDLRRRRRVRRTTSIETYNGANSDDNGSDRLAGPPTDAIHARRLDVTQMLSCLTEEHREVLTLRELNGHTYEEIAELLSLPVGTVESRIFRARQVVRERFAGYFESSSSKGRSSAHE
jgi:RNA polymerase sigma-70 factor (ECF subfamily)